MRTRRLILIAVVGSLAATLTIPFASAEICQQAGEGAVVAHAAAWVCVPTPEQGYPPAVSVGVQGGAGDSEVVSLYANSSEVSAGEYQWIGGKWAGVDFENRAVGVWVVPLQMGVGAEWTNAGVGQQEWEGNRWTGVYAGTVVNAGPLDPVRVEVVAGQWAGGGGCSQGAVAHTDAGDLGEIDLTLDECPAEVPSLPSLPSP